MVKKETLVVPLVAALATLVVRLLTYKFREYIPLPFHFGITTPNTAAESWKEAVFWKHQFGDIPKYLVAVVPWYVEYFPSMSSEAYVTILSLLDALTAFFVSQWPSAIPQLVFTLFVLNPVMVLLPALESLAPLEHFVLMAIIECCRRRRRHAWFIVVARCFALGLGFSFVAVIVALWFPVGSQSLKYTLFGVVVGEFIVSGCALLYLSVWGKLSAQTSLYAPPDNGVMWYVRLLIIPIFSRCMHVFQIQLPAILTLPVAAALPAETPTTASGYMSSIPSDRRLLLVVFAISLSKLYRCHLTLSDYLLAVLFIYSLLDKTEVLKVGNKEGSKLSMFDRILAANVFLPVYTLLLVVPLQYSFYTGWVMWDTANPNWVFFPQVAFVTVGALFMLTFLRTAFTTIEAEMGIEDKPKKE